jgi:hypothetical protein
MSTLSRRHRVRSSQGETRPCVGMRTITAQAAGVDIRAHELVAGVPDGEDQQIVRTFGTYTADLQTRADWFVDRGIQTLPWHPRASLGCHSSRHWKRVASTAA